MGLFTRNSRDPFFEFLSLDDGRYLRECVRASFAARGLEIEDRGDHVVDSQGRPFGLHNLAAQARTAPPSERAALVDDHVDSLVAAMADVAPITIDDVRERGYVRLMDPSGFPDEALAELEPYTRRLGDSLLQILAIDNPTVVTTVGPKDLAALDMDAAWLAGMDNLRNVEVDLREHTDADGGRIWSLTGESMFVASRMLVLEDEVALVGDAPFGALVIAPDRHHLHFHVIRDLGALKVVTLFANVARGAYGDEPGGLSPQVYWWRDGVLAQLTRDQPDGRVAVVPPDDLVAILNTLPPAA